MPRSPRDMDRKREATRGRVRRYRERKKQSVTSATIPPIGVTTEQSSKLLLPPVGVIAKDSDINYRLIYWGGRWIRVSL